MNDKQTLVLDLHQDRSAQPKHERLRDYLVAEILAGRLKPGVAIPSENALVGQLGVARSTVRQAMSSLEEDGLIRRVQGKGTFVEADVRRKLRRGQDLFALVVPETREGFYPSLLRGFEAAAADIHHQTIICNTDNDVVRQGDIILQLLDKEVGGVAINSSDAAPTPAYQIRQLQKHGIPVVFCHRGVEGIVAPLLAIPFYDVGYLAGKVLAERGHRRVALFGCHRAASMQASEQGLNDALQAGGSVVPIQSLCVEERPANVREQLVWASLQQMFAVSGCPTAIVCTFDSLAEVIYLRLQRLGLRVPEDVSLLGFGGKWREGAITQHLTSVVVDEIATGQQAVALLHAMRSGLRPIDDDTRITMELSLSEGETLGPAKE
jgi:GntR family transcriptional regulator, arabinose operon transcriptional repressor